MVARFALGKRAVMTGTAIIHDAGMVKSCRYKARGDMTHMAIIIGWHMVRRRRLAWGSCAIVARPTTINDTRVIKPGTDKGGGDMAYRAVLRRRQMILRLAGRCHTIMAG